LERLWAAGLELLEAEVVALDQEGPALPVDEAVFELAAVGVALQEAGGDPAVLRDVGDALESGEPAVDPAAEDQEQRNVHDPDAEPGVAPALGEDEAILDLDAVSVLSELLRHLLRTECRRGGSDSEAEPGHVIEAPLGVADQVVD